MTTAAKIDCPYCGSAQAPHALLWFDAAVSFLVSHLPSAETLVRRIVPGHVIPLLLTFVTEFLLLPLRLSGIIHFEALPSKKTSPRIRAVWKEALRRGYIMEQISIVGNRGELCRVKAKANERWEYFTSLPEIMSRDSTTAPNIDDKLVCKQVLSKAGIRTARGTSCSTYGSALRAFRTLESPVIVKPRFGSRARHTTIDIRNQDTFRTAVNRARTISPILMVEEFIPGDIYRATCIDGRLIGVIHFIRPQITADGIHTAIELLMRHNARKLFPSLTDVHDDQLFTECLTRQGLERKSIPADGTTLLLAEHSERPNGGYFIDCTDALPEDNRHLIQAAAQACRAPIIGFDIISRDITRSHHEEPLTFIEANRAPFIELHDIPFQGIPRNIASALWDLWEERRYDGTKNKDAQKTDRKRDAGCFCQ